jgi:hypothetical protein
MYEGINNMTFIAHVGFSISKKPSFLILERIRIGLKCEK